MSHNNEIKIMYINDKQYLSYKFNLFNYAYPPTRKLIRYLEITNDANKSLHTHWKDLIVTGTWTLHINLICLWLLIVNNNIQTYEAIIELIAVATPVKLKHKSKTTNTTIERLIICNDPSYLHYNIFYFSF